MFRLILYLHELKHERGQVSIWQRIAYFLMLPNLVFPIFPIVDYNAFKRKYYDTQEIKIYQRGVHLMAKSVFLILLYRILYYVAPPVGDINNVKDLFNYIVMAYLMMVRLVGVLTFAVGSLCLFGFNLPDIFNHMFFAKDFGDLWRRVNIYWRDFLVKIVFNPIYFRLKKRGTKFALIVATILLIIPNWFFHSYQWFWALGNFPVKIAEILTWISLGLLVTATVAYQLYKKKKKQDTPFVITLKITGTFLSMAFIYSLFISHSFTDWWEMLHQKGTLAEWAYIFGVISIAVIVGTLYFHYKTNWDEKLAFFTKYGITVNLIILFALTVSVLPHVASKMPSITSDVSYTDYIEHHLNQTDKKPSV